MSWTSKYPSASPSRQRATFVAFGVLMHSRVLASILVIVVASAGGTRLAHAAPTPEAIALQRFEEGRTAYEAKRYDEALAAFRASLEQQPSPNSRLYIGRCLRELGKTASAFTSLRLAAREAQDRLVASGEKRYAATRDAANQEAAELEARVPYATIAVPSDVPTDYRVLLDGEALPRSAWGAAIPLDPGAHLVVTDGHRIAKREERFVLKDGDKLRVEARAARIPTASLALAFPTRPVGLAVQIDGVAIDVADAATPRELDPGEHTVDATAPGHRPFHARRTLADRDDVVVAVKLDPLPTAAGASGTPKWTFFAVSAASVAALGAGTYFALSATASANDEKAKDPLVRDPAVQDRVRAQATTANVLFIAGATLAVGAGVLFFTTRWSDRAGAKGVGVGAWTVGGGGVLGVGGAL